ncbi:unnamed protein product [Chrysoparadoxa australica]
MTYPALPKHSSSRQRSRMRVLSRKIARVPPVTIAVVAGLVVSLFMLFWLSSLQSQIGHEQNKQQLRSVPRPEPPPRPPRGKQNNTGLAWEQSLGYFDMPDNDWERIKSIHRSQLVKNQDGNRRSRAQEGQAWVQKNEEPSISCEAEVRMGPGGDGGKWVCNPHRIPQQDCLVYSIGSNRDFGFEDAIHRDLPGCEVHTFDWEDYSNSAPWYISFHRLGLEGSASAKQEIRPGLYPMMEWSIVSQEDAKAMGTPFYTLEGLVQYLGHEGRRIDILKIDIEGAEFEVLTPPLLAGTWPDIRQVLVEVHYPSEMMKRHVVADLFDAFRDAGYAIFHKEPNIQFSSGAATEWALLRLNL